MMINTATARKATAFFTLIGSLILLNFCEDKVFKYYSFGRGMFIYLLMLTTLAVGNFGLVTFVRFIYHRSQVYKRIQERKSSYFQRRSQITCLICNPEGYQKKYEEEQLKRERRAAQKIDI